MRKDALAEWIYKVERITRIRPPVELPFPTLQKPLIPKLSAKLTSLLNYVPRRSRWLAFCVYIAIWITVSGLLISFNNYKATTSAGTPQYISCTSQLWEWKVESCGLNGTYCFPFSNQSFVIRCPSMCHQTFNQNKRWLGDSQVGFMQPWVVGGGNSNYRAESWLCPSAIHAGIVSSVWGGCAAVNVVGPSSNYESTSANGLTSLAFPSWFPKSYRLRAIPSSYCTDFSWGILPIFIIFILLFPLLHPSRGGFIFALVTSGFWYIIFINIPNHSESWTSGAWGNYLVALTYTFVLWRLFVRHTVPSPSRFPLDLFLFYTIPFYFALHMETITAPLANFGLTSRAFRETTTLIVFVVAVPIVVTVCLVQLWFIRRHGVLGKYILGYGLAIIAYFLLPAILSLHVHLHHYILGIILLPLTRLQTRPGFLMQGFCLGLVIQGLGRWGPASPFDTSFQNLAGDEAVWIPRPAFAIDPVALRDNGTVSWRFQDAGSASTTIDTGLPYDGYSVLVNDVEMYRGPVPTTALTQLLAETDKTRPYYVRVALVSSGSALEYSYPTVITGSGNVTYPNGTTTSP
ncbi:hypothetical protein DFS34DRAFT_581656 [Phlyctochytrium arcticum]|nr:hypothetical protein DFS34DRAFT_581656 [Phlyctochytrium arcticum]